MADRIRRTISFELRLARLWAMLSASIAVTCFCYLTPCAVQAQSVRATVIRGATLIDGTGRAPVRNAVVVISDNRITEVEASASQAYPPGAEIYDATGKFIIPGLFESHDHYPEWGGELFLAYGITSVMDVGNSTE